MTKSAVSISSELHLIQRALDAVGLLLRQWADHRCDEDEVRRVAPGAQATVVLLRERVRLPERVVGETVDPRLILMSENRGHDLLADDDQDLTLPVWSVEKTRMKAGRSRSVRAASSTGSKTAPGSGAMMNATDSGGSRSRDPRRRATRRNEKP